MPESLMLEKLFSRWRDWAGRYRDPSWGTEKEDGIFWSRSSAGLMEQVSTNQISDLVSFPGVLLIGLQKIISRKAKGCINLLREPCKC